jgi:hypothetical protein
MNPSAKICFILCLKNSDAIMRFYLGCRKSAHLPITPPPFLSSIASKTNFVLQITSERNSFIPRFAYLVRHAKSHRVPQFSAYFQALFKLGASISGFFLILSNFNLKVSIIFYSFFIKKSIISNHSFSELKSCSWIRLTFSDFPGVASVGHMKAVPREVKFRINGKRTLRAGDKKSKTL